LVEKESGFLPQRRREGNMGLFSVTYDLIGKKDYQKLWDEFDNLGAHKALNSYYLVNYHADKPSALLNHLEQFIDDDDRLLVQPFSRGPAYRNALKGTKAWLKANM
jgi:hypothetical protein